MNTISRWAAPLTFLAALAASVALLVMGVPAHAAADTALASLQHAS